MYLEECKHCINSQHGMPAMRNMLSFKIFFILLQETIQRPFENDDSPEQKKQQTTEKSSATTPTGQSTGKNLPRFESDDNLYLKRRHGMADEKVVWYSSEDFQKVLVHNSESWNGCNTKHFLNV